MNLKKTETLAPTATPVTVWPLTQKDAGSILARWFKLYRALHKGACGVSQLGILKPIENNQANLQETFKAQVGYIQNNVCPCASSCQ